MFKNTKFNYILVFILVTIVLIYLGKLLYGNLNNKLDYKTTIFDEDTDDSDTDDSDTDDSDTDNKRTEITELIDPIPKKILEGPLNDKADLSRTK